jgi:hypothetical protein
VDRQTDMTELIVTFRNFVNAPEKVSGRPVQYLNGKHFRCLQFLSLVLHDSFFFSKFSLKALKYSNISNCGL